MDNNSQQDRRHDLTTAGHVQCGIALLYVAGAVAARRYLTCRAVPDIIIERVLRAPSERHRNCCPQYMPAAPLIELLQKVLTTANAI